MGNNQSSAQKECPSTFCKALCFGRPPNSDEGEWFGDLPKDTIKKKRRKSRKNRESTRLPSVPEEAATCSETVETVESSSVLSSSLPSSTASKCINEADGVCSSNPVLERRVTDLQEFKSSSKAIKLPKNKLVFVNGQFVDVSTEDGLKIAERMASKEEPDGPSPDDSIHGIESHMSGHCGVVRGSSDPNRSPSRSPSRILTASLPGMLKRSTFASSISTTSSFSSQESDQEKESLRESVSSIVMLEEGYFLTASVADRNIKMWKLSSGDNDGERTSITFIRDFSACPMGTTCLTKVDRKGRFLSGCKSGNIMLWDSRFNCNDPKEGEGERELSSKNQVLLATFEKLERRKVDTIAMIEDGSYVRPTDDVDWSMLASITKKAVQEGTKSVQRAARERQIIACSLQFASITGAHRSVKIWSVTHTDNKGDESKGGNNVAEIKLLQELEHDNVVESIATVLGKSTLLAGDRMGNVVLWKSIKNVFKRDSPKIWHRVRTFNWRHGELYKCKESVQFSITSLSFLGEKYFVSGARGGGLRLWNVNGSGVKDEIVHEELIGLSGAHTSEVTCIITGRDVIESPSKEKMMTFTTCGKDGMVLSFVAPSERPIPCCFNVVNLGIDERYTCDGDSMAALSLGCHENDQCTTLLVGSSCGSIKVLHPRDSRGSHDALRAYREQIKDEALTLHLIAENARRAIECSNRKKHMQTYTNCFAGSELVSYLVDEKHALTRNDAVKLGCALQKHLSLFCHVSKESQLLQDDIRSLYRFTSPTMHRSATV